AHGFLPILMADPSEALVEAKERTPAVVVVDLVMPGMSGLELVTRLRTHYGRSCPPVLLVSANLTQLSPMEQILFDHLFPKPYSVNAFIGVVRSMVRAHVARRASPNPSRQQSAGARREDDGR